MSLFHSYKLTLITVLLIVTVLCNFLHDARCAADFTCSAACNYAVKLLTEGARNAGGEATL